VGEQTKAGWKHGAMDGVGEPDEKGGMEGVLLARATALLAEVRT